MKTRVIPVVLGVFVFLGFGGLLSQQNPEDAKFAKTMEAFLDEYWKFYPTAGTLAGFTKYNDRLEDLSESSIEKRGTALDGYNKDLVTKVNKDKLSPEIQIDRDLLMDAIDLELLRLDNLVPQQYNPIFYNEIILHSIRSLLVMELGPIETRLKNATERAKELPGFLKQAKENLKTPPKEYTEAAIKQFAAILGFYRIEVPKLIEKVSGEVKTKFQAELAKVIPALEDFQRFLQGDLLNRSTGNFRLGPDAHAKIIRLTCQSSNLMNEFGARATADFTNIRREMFLVCIPFYKIMDPKFDIENPPKTLTPDQLYNTVIAHVMNKLRGAQATKEEFIGLIKKSAEEVKTFLNESKLLEMPGENLAIEAAPAEERSAMMVRLLLPSPYGNPSSFSCQISPVPEDWSNEQVQSFLDEYNSYFVNWLAIQKVYPGEFFPAYFSLKNASLARKLYPSKPLFKGWPLYTEDLFMDNGFGNYDLRLRLSQLKSKLKAVLDFQLEFNIHQQTMTKENAIRYMTISGFQTQAEAERKWDMITLNPGEAAYPYVGYQEILDMEKDYKKLKGNAFDAKEFLQKLLSYGPVPLRVLKAKLSE
jgi:hypothetical protein